MSNFQSFRNDTFPLNVQVTKVPQNAPAGTPPAPVDITGWTVWFTVKFALSDPDADAVFQGSTPPGSGVVITDAPNGLVTCTMPGTATQNFPATVVPLVYDVQAKDPSGNVTTIDYGTIVVMPDVTIRTS